MLGVGGNLGPGMCMLKKSSFSLLLRFVPFSLSFVHVLAGAHSLSPPNNPLYVYFYTI